MFLPTILGYYEIYMEVSNLALRAESALMNMRKLAEGLDFRLPEGGP